MRNLNRRDSMSSFIHFSLPLSIPLEHALFIQPQFKCTRAEVRSFDGDQGLILIGDVFFLVLWWTPRECKLARTQKDRDRSVVVEHFTIHHEESTEAWNKTAQEHYERKMTMFLGRTTKLYDPKNLTSNLRELEGINICFSHKSNWCSQ
jgi:hypothetical protein